VKDLTLSHMFMTGIYSLSKPNLHVRAAMTPPKIGATIKSHNWARALPSARRAGPRLRAGLTDVPVTEMVTRWISIRVKPLPFIAR